MAPASRRKQKICQTDIYPIRKARDDDSDIVKHPLAKIDLLDSDSHQESKHVVNELPIEIKPLVPNVDHGQQQGWADNAPLPRWCADRIIDYV